MTPPPITIGPQPGPQTAFLESAADIAITGGSAGGGKSYSLALACAQWSHVPGFGAIVFRRTAPELVGAGSIWETTKQIYRYLGGTPRESPMMEWRFPSGATIEFRHLQREDDVYAHQSKQYALIVFDELTHFCVTPDHDVLTKRGWVPIADVRKGDQVLARVGEGAEFREVLDTPRFDYDGELVRVSQRTGVSLRATPNHRVLVQRQDEQRSLGFVEASRLHESIQSVPRRAVLRGRACRTTPMRFAMPAGRGIGRNQNSAAECHVDTWLEFLGWYLSEGCVSGSHVRIAQTKPAPDLDDLMRRLPWRAVRDGRGGWVVCSRQLANELKPLGNTYTKRVPRWVADCSPRQIRVFLDAFVRGDGHATKTGGITIGLANKLLRDDLQELFALGGRVATSWDGCDSTGRFDVYGINVSKATRDTTMIKPGSVTRERYTGPVYCPVVDCPDLPDFTRGGYQRAPVPGGNFFVRHNGRCHFTGNTTNQFWYMVSRLRSTCGVRPHMRASCNPDPDSFVRRLIDWWLDADTGLAIPERSGALRWFVRSGDTLNWYDSRELALEAHPGSSPMSLTFIAAKLDDNPALLKVDPGYRGRLEALGRVDRERLLGANWNIRAQAGTVFQRSWFGVVAEAPRALRTVRAWDKAATKPSPANPDPDWTVGARVSIGESGVLCIEHIEMLRDTVHAVDMAMRHTAEQDGVAVPVAIWQDPGQAGVVDVSHTHTNMLGFVVRKVKASQNKLAYATPWSALAEAGKVVLVRGSWNTAFLDQAESFPDGAHDDAVDAVSLAFQILSGRAVYSDGHMPHALVEDKPRHAPMLPGRTSSLKGNW